MAKGIGLTPTRGMNPQGMPMKMAQSMAQPKMPKPPRAPTAKTKGKKSVKMPRGMR
jgi:hypothetical protein